MSRGATQPFSRGRLTSPPPLCASDTGGLGPTKVKTRSDAVVASQSRLLRMLKSQVERKTAQTQILEQGHRLNRLLLIESHYACARSYGRNLMRMTGVKSVQNRLLYKCDY